MNGCDASNTLFIAPYASLSESQKLIRNHCFPNYEEYTSDDVPSVGVSQMLIVDKVGYTLRWNATVAKEVADVIWVYQSTERTDDFYLSNLIGYFVYADFHSRSVSNTNVFTTTEKDWLKQLKDPSEVYTMDVECWSVRCPHWLNYNPANYTFWINADEINGYRVNGTYIYKVDLTPENGVTERQTITVHMQLALAPSVTSLININQPFHLWYELNKASLPSIFYAPAPQKVPEKGASLSELISTKALDQITMEFGEQVLSEL